MLKFLPDFTTWHNSIELPEVGREVLCHDGELMTYLCFILNKDTGYMDLGVLGRGFWKNFVNDYKIKYWFYVDEIKK